MWMIEIHRGIAALARRIDIDHFNIFADRARLEVRFPAYIERCLVDAKRFQAGAKRRVIGIDAQRPVRWLADLRALRMLELQPLNCIPEDRQSHRYPDLVPAHGSAKRLSQRLGRTRMSNQRL